MKKKDYLRNPVQHIDITKFDSGEIVNAMKGMSFQPGTWPTRLIYTTGCWQINHAPLS